MITGLKSTFCPNHLNITIFSAILKKENKLGNKTLYT